MYGRASSWPASGLRHDRAGDVDRDGEADAVARPTAIAVLMPMTLPSASSSGPPELPGLIAASVWIRLLSGLVEPSVVIERPVAETMPLVTEFEYVPSGLPIAITSWPTLSASESPMRGGRQVRARRS